MKKVFYQQTMINRPNKDLPVGETIEKKIERIVHTNEPITDGAPIIFTEKKDGVLAGTNIRTDRWEIAAEAMNVVHRSQTAKSGEVMGKGETENKNDGKPESTHGEATT